MARVRLSAEARAEVERRCQREQRTRQWRRYRALLLLHDGWTGEAVAAAVGCSPASVWNGQRAYAARGVSGLEGYPRPGAARRVAPAGAALLGALLGTDPQRRGWQATGWTVPMLREEVARAGYPVSAHTVRRTLHRLRWRWKRPACLLGRPDPAYDATKG